MISVVKPDGKKKQKIFGTAASSVRNAAITLAVYEDKPYELPAKKKLYGPPSKEKVEKAKHRRLALLCSKEANALLEEIYPGNSQAPEAAYVEVEPGVFMVGVEAIEGAVAGAPTVAFTPMSHVVCVGLSVYAWVACVCKCISRRHDAEDTTENTK